ncbi:hypothetical protein MMC19_005295 [Ptychographa xylographoides]|nr:hypothetical protein [Ptychographa xylographoides]
MSSASIPRPDLLTTIWICHTCAVTNLVFNNPDDCAVCKHQRCELCKNVTSINTPLQLNLPQGNITLEDRHPVEQLSPHDVALSSTSSSSKPRPSGQILIENEDIESLATELQEKAIADETQVTRPNPDVLFGKDYAMHSEYDIFNGRNWLYWQQKFYSQKSPKKYSGRLRTTAVSETNTNDLSTGPGSCYGMSHPIAANSNSKLGNFETVLSNLYDYLTLSPPAILTRCKIVMHGDFYVLLAGLQRPNILI